jgi:hypothetical protein
MLSSRERKRSIGNPPLNTDNDSTDSLKRAFCEAVERYALGEWSPAAPEECTVRVRNKGYSLREICLLVLSVDGPLPEKTVAQLFQSIHARHDRLREKLTARPRYLVGARCLIALMDDSEDVYALREACRR